MGAKAATSSKFNISSEWRRKIDDFLLNLAAGFYTTAAWLVVTF